MVRDFKGRSHHILSVDAAYTTMKCAESGATVKVGNNSFQDCGFIDNFSNGGGLYEHDFCAGLYEDHTDWWQQLNKESENK